MILNIEIIGLWDVVCTLIQFIDCTAVIAVGFGSFPFFLILAFSWCRMLVIDTKNDCQTNRTQFNSNWF